jgi:hypothetical protein
MAIAMGVDSVKRRRRVRAVLASFAASALACFDEKSGTAFKKLVLLTASQPFSCQFYQI